MNLLRLVQGISKRYESHVVSLTSIGPLGERIRELGTDVQALGMKKGLPDPRGVIRLARIVRRFNPHVIQSWMYHANLLGLSRPTEYP